MKFVHRFAYYLIGLFIGSFAVAAIFMGKDTRCNYFPNARVLNDLRNKPFEIYKNITPKLEKNNITTEDIKNTLTYGDVDFDQSNVVFENGKKYVIEGKTTKNQKILVIMINYPNKALLYDVNLIK